MPEELAGLEFELPPLLWLPSLPLVEFAAAMVLAVGVIPDFAQFT